MATNYDINYEDERFAKVEADKQQALTEIEDTYNGMIGESKDYYQAQIDATKQWGDKQQQLQQENTDFAIEKIEQQKEQAHKDYLREQSGAYVDWQKQIDDYGANAEQMASMGLTNSGYSESSKVSMYNAYQQRVASARESYQRAVLNYDNAIKEAQLQNDSALAQIAFETLQKELELSLQGFQYENQLVLTLADKKLQIDDTYYNRYQNVLQQMNTENALAEQVRQYNASLEEQKRQFNAKLEEDRRQFNIKQAASGGGSGGSAGLKVNEEQIKKAAKNSFASKTKSTGLKLGDVLSDQELREYNLSPNSTIVSSGGEYYVKVGGDYVALGYLKKPINAALTEKGSLKGKDSIVKAERY